MANPFYDESYWNSEGPIVLPPVEVPRGPVDDFNQNPFNTGFNQTFYTGADGGGGGSAIGSASSTAAATNAVMGPLPPPSPAYQLIYGDPLLDKIAAERIADINAGRARQGLPPLTEKTANSLIINSDGTTTSLAEGITLDVEKGLQAEFELQDAAQAQAARNAATAAKASGNSGIPLLIPIPGIDPITGLAITAAGLIFSGGQIARLDPSNPIGSVVNAAQGTVSTVQNAGSVLTGQTDIRDIWGVGTGTGTGTPTGSSGTATGSGATGSEIDPNAGNSTNVVPVIGGMGSGSTGNASGGPVSVTPGALGGVPGQTTTSGGAPAVVGTGQIFDPASVLRQTQQGLNPSPTFPGESTTPASVLRQTQQGLNPVTDYTFPDLSGTTVQTRATLPSDGNTPTGTTTSTGVTGTGTGTNTNTGTTTSTGTTGTGTGTNTGTTTSTGTTRTGTGTNTNTGTTTSTGVIGTGTRTNTNTGTTTSTGVTGSGQTDNPTTTSTTVITGTTPSGGAATMPIITSAPTFTFTNPTNSGLAQRDFAKEFGLTAATLTGKPGDDLAAYYKQLQQQFTPSSLTTLGTTAETQLAADLARYNQAQSGNLSAEDTRSAQQSAREAYGARGQVMGRGAIGAEILNRAALQRQRESEARASVQQSIGNLRNAADLQTGNIFAPTAKLIADTYSPTSAYAREVYDYNVNAYNAYQAAQQNLAAYKEAASKGQEAQFINSFVGFLANNGIKTTISGVQSIIDSLIKPGASTPTK